MVGMGVAETGHSLEHGSPVLPGWGATGSQGRGCSVPALMWSVSVVHWPEDDDS